MSKAVAAAPGSKPAVIRGVPGRRGMDWTWLLWAVLPAWVISAVAHTLIIGFAILMALLIAWGATPVEAAAPLSTETALEEQADKSDLTNPDLGLNPEVPLNYNVDRIEDVSVPGPVDPAAAVGIPGAPADAVVQNVPAPAGFGGGLGGGLDSTIAGKAAMNDMAGGMAGIGMPGGFAGRSGSTREKMVTEGGGNPVSEAAVASGLLWMATHQADNGSWKLHEYNKWARNKPTDGFEKRFDDKSQGVGLNNDTAGTAFGLLPFLAAGITHRPNKDKKAQYDYSKQVYAGLRFLIAQQALSKGKGDFGGGMYSHGLATIAMCEAYGLTSDPELKASAQAGINFIVYAQDDKGGGWRYSPKQAGDTSVVGWQVMALKSGQMAGLSIPPTTLKLAERFLDSCMSSDKGDYGYVAGNPATNKESPASAMTAVGLLCRQYLGWSPRNEGLLNGVSRIRKAGPGQSGAGMYYYYYATQVMHHMGGDNWEFWNKGIDPETKKKVHDGMRDWLIKRQDNTKSGRKPKVATDEGSWDPNGDGHGAAGGRVMTTSLSLLTLEVYYRHLPLYRRDTATNKMPGEEMKKE